MSSTPQERWLPRLIDPRKFAQQAQSLAGCVPIRKLERLGGLLVHPQGEQDALAEPCKPIESGQIKANLVFGINEQGQRYVSGHVSAEVFMTCQRCLEPCPQNLDVEVNLAIVWSEEQADNLSKELDPWIVGEDQADIYELIEEELILSLPIVAYHDYACVDHTLYSSGEGDNAVLDLGRAINLGTNGAETDVNNPFQALAGLKAELETNEQSRSVIEEADNGRSKK